MNLMSESNLVFPDFNHSIVNLAASMAQFLGSPVYHPILPCLTEKLKPTYQHVVYMVVDAMGASILEKNLPADSFLRTHQIDTVTSVFPSTTAAATTSLLSGLTPAEHGWFAWSVDFDGEVIELFRNRNYYTKEFLADKNFVSRHLPYARIYEQTNGDREIYTCFPNIAIEIRSPHDIRFNSLGHMFRRLHKICAMPEKNFVYTYYPNLDSTMHTYGTTAWHSRHLLKKIERGLKHFAKKHPDTLFVVTADHGQNDVKGFSYICDDAAIQDCLLHPVSLDPRGVCFKIKPGKDADFKAAFKKYEKDFTLFASKDLIQKGVFGDFKMHPEYSKYLGDYIAVGGETNHFIVFQQGDQYRGKNIKRLYHGEHTGMTADEMYVPLIVVGN